MTDFCLNFMACLYILSPFLSRNSNKIVERFYETPVPLSAERDLISERFTRRLLGGLKFLSLHQNFRRAQVELLQITSDFPKILRIPVLLFHKKWILI